MRGPAPSCQVAAVKRLNGREGTNTVEFTGRLAGRRLAPGVYWLSVTRKPVVADEAVGTPVRVVSKHRVVPATGAPAHPTCAETAAPANSLATLIVPGERAPHSGNNAAEDADLPTLAPAPGDEANDVAGAQFPFFSSPSDATGRDAIAAFGVAALVGALLLTLGTLVVRFLRGSWNP